MVQRKRRSTSKKSSQLNFSFLKPLLLLTVIVAIIYFAVNSINFSDLLQSDVADTQPEIGQTDTLQKRKQLKLTDTPAVSEHQIIRKPQVEILNGCGVSSITDLFRDFFAANNVDVISTGNYLDFNQDKSFLIVYSKSHLELAKKLAMLLRIDEQLIREEYQEKPLNELALVLGKDYGALKK
ncbi:MAG: LytR C-terminal domain-containing protein [Calditrichaeota bacterium]|nr:LytR C-terminal domain-containing protein [Calditrichota bacterium]